MKRASGSRWVSVVSVVSVVVLSVAAGCVLTSSAESGPGASSVLVPITPCRLMDTRAGAGVGVRALPIGAGETYAPLVWGTNGNCTIPVSATAVSMNVTFVNPSAQSYLTVYPPDAVLPITSNLNWVAGQAPAPNAVTVRLSADGRVGFYNFVGSVDLIADIVGYYEPSAGGVPGPAGPTGPTGPTGATGPKGETGPVGPVGAQGVSGADGRTVLSGQGVPDEMVGVDGDFYIDVEKWAIFGPKDHGTWPEPTEMIGPQGATGPTGATGATGDPGPRPAHVVWVAASGGDFTTVTAALNSITDNSSTNQYVIKVAPGTYTEPNGISLKDYVDIEGSGQDVTTITCPGCSEVMSAFGPLTSEVRHLTVGTAANFLGISNLYVAAGSVSFLHVTANGEYAVYNHNSSPTMNNVTANGVFDGVYNYYSSPTMNNVTANGEHGVYNVGSAPTIRNSVITGSSFSIGNFSASTAKVANCILSGPLLGAGTFTGSYGNVTPDFVPVANP